MTAPKDPPVRRTRKQGFLHCRTCQTTIPYIAMGEPELDMPYPMHRCGRDIRPFDGWREDDPRPRLAGRSPFELEDL